MKFIGLSHDEAKYCATLDWDELMVYLEKKYGTLYKNEFKRRLEREIQNHIEDKASREKWR